LERRVSRERREDSKKKEKKNGWNGHMKKKNETAR
jgi:hypothetical protein